MTGTRGSYAVPILPLMSRVLPVPPHPDKSFSRSIICKLGARLGDGDLYKIPITSPVRPSRIPMPIVTG